jgi:Raf kinase inhibitor-like YbhB/YbcL family protein
MSFTLVSPAFPNGGPIAARYTCDGADLSPAFAWSEVPAAAQSLALIADDPDAPAGTWTHWLLWNIPARATFLAENAPKVEVLDNGARQGINDFQPHRLWRPVSASGQAPPLLLPALRPRRPPRPQARRHPRRIGTRHGAAHPRPDPVDGHLQALAIIDARRSQQPIHPRPSLTPSTRRPAIDYPARTLPGGNGGDLVPLKTTGGNGGCVGSHRCRCHSPSLPDRTRAHLLEIQAESPQVRELSTEKVTFVTLRVLYAVM